MAEVFLSYTPEDQGAAAAVVRGLESVGVSVWWDHTIPPGRAWDDVIVEAIDAAGVAIVIWSHHALASDTVKEEAQVALADQKYLPVVLDDVVPPMGFRRVQACNLAGWDGDPAALAFQSLVQAVRAKLPAPVQAIQAPAAPPIAPPQPAARAARPAPSAASGPERRWIMPVLIGIGVLAALCIAVLLWRENVDGAGRRIEADRGAWAAIDTTDPYAVGAFRDHAQSRQYRDLAADRLEELRASGATVAPPVAPTEQVNAPPAVDPLAGNWNFSSASFPCGDGDCQLEGVMTVTPQGGAYACNFSVVQTSSDQGRTSAEESCNLSVGADGRIEIASRVTRSNSGAWAADHFTLTQSGADELSGITHDGRQTTSGVPVTFSR